MVSPKFLVLVFRKKLDALVAKDHFVSYIKNSGFGVFGPAGGLDKPTDRDQRSRVFLTYPNKYFATDRTPKKYFPKSKTLKNTLKYAIHLAKVKHNLVIMENRDH